MSNRGARIVIWLSAGLVVLFGIGTFLEEDDHSRCETLNSLAVAEERDREGYNRDDFGTYDREALLEASEEQNEGKYYSVFDDKLYDDAGEVDVDHVVALAEAWDSGIDSDDMKTYGGDTTNLVLLTDSVNQSKGDKDAAEWQPTDNVAYYVDIYITTKRRYNLSVDQVELEALQELVATLSGAELKEVCVPSGR